MNSLSSVPTSDFDHTLNFSRSQGSLALMFHRCPDTHPDTDPSISETVSTDLFGSAVPTAEAVALFPVPRSKPWRSRAAGRLPRSKPRQLA